MTTSYSTANFDTLRPATGPQNQLLLTACLGPRLSNGWVVLKPGHIAKAHVHQHHDIIVSVLYGHVESLVGDELDRVVHGPGDSIQIPAGQPHTGINLLVTQPAVVVETRSDPDFNGDVTLLPDLDARVRELGKRHQRAFTQPHGPLSVVDRILEMEFLALTA